MTTTSAPGTTAPCPSVTRPPSVARAPWPQARDALTTRAQASRIDRIAFINMLPWKPGIDSAIDAWRAYLARLAGFSKEDTRPRFADDSNTRRTVGQIYSAGIYSTGTGCGPL